MISSDFSLLAFYLDYFPWKYAFLLLSYKQKLDMTHDFGTRIT